MGRTTRMSAGSQAPRSRGLIHYANVGVDHTDVRERTMHDVIIRGADICDGTGAQRRRGDVAVRDGRIVEVGRVDGSARRSIDAAGLALAPGFIDLHTHYDCQVSWDRALTPSCWHGVTTVVMGNCGFTIAPCRPTDRELLMRMLLYVEGMPTEAL